MSEESAQGASSISLEKGTAKSATKNANKKARQFDFDTMFAQTIQDRLSEQEAAHISKITLHGEDEEEIEWPKKKDEPKKEKGRDGGETGGDNPVSKGREMGN